METIDACLAKYPGFADPGIAIRPCPTQSTAEDHRESPAGALGIGPLLERPWCRRAAPPQSCWSRSAVDRMPSRTAKSEIDNVHEVTVSAARRTDRRKFAAADDKQRGLGLVSTDCANYGRLQSIARRITLKV